MEKKKTLDVRIPNMNLVPKWAFLGLKLKKKVDLENEAHFEVFFQIYPSMLENFTGVLTISTLVRRVISKNSHSDFLESRANNQL